jgi:restriction system protein
LNPSYLELAAKRVATRWPPFRQPEDFGYDFREWVSPYTKSAHASGSLAIVLQDWSGTDMLEAEFDPEVQQYGRKPTLKTNRFLDSLLDRVLGLQIGDVYVTNVFPFVKPGSISAGIGLRNLVKSAETFAVHELRLAQPTQVVALGSHTHAALTRAGVPAVALPHPAARGLSLDAHAKRWREVFLTA